MATMRPLVLWTCAVLLGGVVGLNYVRVTRAAASTPVKQAADVGFEDSHDFDEIAKLLDSPKVTSLSDSEIALLDKYATGTSRAPAFVAGVLSNVYGDALANKVLPIAVKVARKIPDHPIVQELPKTWAKQGNATAAAALRAYVPEGKAE